MAPHLLLLRHGQSTWNAEGRWQGWADPPLSAAGVAQAEAALPALLDAGFEAVVSSDLERARATAEILARGVNAPVEVDARLRERDVGAWVGLTAAGIEQRWPGRLEAWRAGRLVRPPGGESDAQLEARALDALHLLSSRPERAVLVVTHAGVLRLVERRLSLDMGNTGHLYGRWVQLTPSELVPGTAFAPPAPPDLAPRQDARRPLAAGIRPPR